MNAAPTPSESQVQAAVAGFLALILPPGTQLVEGQDTAVPEPVGSAFVVVTPITRPRLATNLVLYADCELTGAIAGSVLTVSSVKFGGVVLGSTIWGTKGDVADGTTIVSQLTGGPDGVGTYQLDCTPQRVPSEVMACGNMRLTSDFELTLQLDVHGSNPRESTDLVGTITALLRDEYATSYFDALKIGVSPLYADEPRQAPFLNAEQAWETRWTVDAHFEVNQTITLPMQFATAVQVEIRPTQ